MKSNTTFRAPEIITAVALTVIAFTVVTLLFPAMKSADVASWVQAIGSIAAIAGAYLVGERQAHAAHVNDLKLQQAEADRKNGSILAIVAAAHAEASNIAALYKGLPPPAIMVGLTYDAQTMSDLIDALAAIPVHEIGSYGAVTAFLQLRKSFTYLKRHLDKDDQLLFTSDTSGNDELDKKRTELSTVIRTNCGLVNRYFGQLEEALGARKYSRLG